MQVVSFIARKSIHFESNLHIEFIDVRKGSDELIKSDFTSYPTSLINDIGILFVLRLIYS